LNISISIPASGVAVAVGLSVAVASWVAVATGVEVLEFVEEGMGIGASVGKNSGVSGLQPAIVAVIVKAVSILNNKVFSLTSMLITCYESYNLYEILALPIITYQLSRLATILPGREPINTLVSLFSI